MDLPRPPQALAALAAFVRERLAEVSDTLFGKDAVAPARQFATVIVAAAGPFATTSYSRARLIRQMHASGLLTDEHLARTQRLLELGKGTHEDVPGAPR